MKNKLVFAAGMAVGYVLGTRAGRDSYEQIRSKAQDLWNSPKVQDTVSSTTETLKNKAPEVQDSLKGALKKKGSGDATSGGGSGDSGDSGDSSSGADKTTGGSAGSTGPSGGDPRSVEETPFQAQEDDTRPDLKA
ncbi:YtxH domain-containing protein [Arthrobacter agilis]|uniref:YtxH domain-containing protein n=1 Tax=Arthrobacter agilis TaxID=37921 RepID=UPI0023657A2E|nr:YtxH domain-containing protein [Arthrobacter agilis]WDF33086.1 YtxH domain-containing protein [Arthrobacter agilis]